LAQFARVGREVQAFGFLVQFDAVDGAGHFLAPGSKSEKINYKVLMKICDRRCQLYMWARSFGRSSTVAGTKPRFLNQCAVRVVGTNNFVRPAARARFSMFFRIRSPSPWVWASGLTVRQAISPIFSSG